MEEIISARISDLNQDQLQQVFSLLQKQQETLVEQSQQLGLQIDAIRAQRSQLMGKVGKLADDMNFIAERMEQLRRGKLKHDDRLNGTAGDLMRVDGTAPGAVIETSTQ